MPPRVVTVGVYGFGARSFIDALRDADVRRLIDVRQRRGVRGRKYAWANSKRLQAALRDAGIEYERRPELAPTTAIRELQYREDERLGVGQRSRVALAEEVQRRYLDEVLDRVDLAPFVAGLPADRTTALLCVEREPAACHRSLIAERLERVHGVDIAHVRPE
ncbi:MAG TPA: DUF488 domain-containing protein [Solirubrobacterales bacterium]|nr:DUF488 domain-containing protein [Solirubrobacterales bacterium]